jgi:hypothetical protein
VRFVSETTTPARGWVPGNTEVSRPFLRTVSLVSLSSRHNPDLRLTELDSKEASRPF